MAKLTVMFTSGACLECDTDARSIVNFFERIQGNDGDVPGWMLFENGYAINTDFVQWMCFEHEE